MPWVLLRLEKYPLNNVFFHFFPVFQYISPNPNIQGGYIPQYPPIQAVPVSRLGVYQISLKTVISVLK